MFAHKQPRLLECFGRQGGAAEGFRRAGFDVTIVDIEDHSRHAPPGVAFVLGDALDYLAGYGHAYDVITGGPPCQRYSLTQRIQGREHPDLIGRFREACRALGKPYLIENVEEARNLLIDPVMLCGIEFGLRTDRHRLFESSIPLAVPAHRAHTFSKVKMGRPLADGDYYHAVGNFSNVPYVRHDLGVPWMTREGIRECIPPVYAEYLGQQLMAHLEALRVRS